MPGRERERLLAELKVNWKLGKIYILRSIILERERERLVTLCPMVAEDKRYGTMHPIRFQSLQGHAIQCNVNLPTDRVRRGFIRLLYLSGLLEFQTFKLSKLNNKIAY